jgi:hypothetical protein
MMNRIKLISIKSLKLLTDNWKVYLVGILTALVLIAIIFAIPIKPVTIESTITYTAIEKVSEPYTELEPYIDYSTNNNTRVLINGFFQVVPNGTTVPFTIEKLNSRIIGHFENSIPGRFAILGIGDRVIWETMGSRDVIDLPLKPGDYKALFKEDVMCGEDCFIFLVVQSGESESIIEYTEVTRYREVEIEVEKQEIRENEARISIWEYLFSESPLLK